MSVGSTEEVGIGSFGISVGLIKGIRVRSFAVSVGSTEGVGVRSFVILLAPIGRMEGCVLWHFIGISMGLAEGTHIASPFCWHLYWADGGDEV